MSLLSWRPYLPVLFCSWGLATHGVPAVAVVLASERVPPTTVQYSWGPIAVSVFVDAGVLAAYGVLSTNFLAYGLAILFSFQNKDSFLYCTVQ
jgi:hypothetical protein